MHLIVCISFRRNKQKNQISVWGSASVGGTTEEMKNRSCLLQTVSSERCGNFQMLTALKAKNGLRYPAVSLSHLTNIRFRYWPNCNKKHPIPNRQNFWETTKDKWIIGECHHSQQILSSRALLPLIGYHLPILRTPYSGHIVPTNAFLFICMRGKNTTKFEKNFSIWKRSWYLSLATTN